MDLILGVEQLDEFIINNKNKLLMLYFSINGCLPCKILKNRILKEGDEQLKDLLVCYIDVGIPENSEIVEMYKDEVKILPTQIFVKLKDDNVTIIDKIVGYDWIKLIMTYNKLVKN